MKKSTLNLCLMALMWLTGMNAWALEKNASGYYEITSAADLKAFAELVNGGENTANAILMNDIDYGTESTMIGADGKDFNGNFDGQNHAIQINMTASADGQALFRNIGKPGHVHNLIIMGTITTAYKYAAGVVVYNSGRVTNVAADVKVNSSLTGDATHGGIAALVYDGAYIVDCLARFTIEGEATENCGGLVGWVDSDKAVVENCLVAPVFNIAKLDGSATIARNSGRLAKAYNNFYVYAAGDTNGGTQVSTDELASGKVCFLLNTDQQNIQWTQTIGTLPFPSPFGTMKQVYCTVDTKCDGTPAVETADIVYTNTPQTTTATAHTLVGGGCTTCTSLINGTKLKRALPQGYFAPNFVERDAEGTFLVKNGEEMEWMSNILSLGYENFSIKLVDDIDYTGKKEWINYDNWFSGTLDGQQHTLKIAIGGGATVSLVPQLAGTFKNLYITGTVQAGETQNAASVASHTRGSNATIENVVSDVVIYSDKDGDGTHGGMVAYTNNPCTMTNVVFAGKIVGEKTHSCGGIIGWTGSNVSPLTNVLFLGSLDIASNDGNHTICRRPGQVSLTNVYYLNPTNNNEGTATTAEDVASGALCFAINTLAGKDVFFQNLGEEADPYPVPDSSHGKVYANGRQHCNGESYEGTVYLNEDKGTVKDDHVFENGFCTYCGAPQEDFLTPGEDGFYELANADEFIWFAALVNSGKTTANARVTGTIDFAGKTQVPVGKSSANAYAGTFDGQGYPIQNVSTMIFGTINGATISNIHVESGRVAVTDKSYADHAGTLVGYGLHGTKKNVIENSYSLVSISVTSGGDAGGFAGKFYGDIRNCYFVGNVDAATSTSAGGFIGSTVEHSDKLGGDFTTIENCYAKVGEFAGKQYLGSLVGYLHRGQVITNCYGTEGIAAFPSGQKNGTVTDSKAVATEAFASGQVAYEMNRNMGGYLYRQNVETDAYPTFDTAKGYVGCIPASQYGSLYVPAEDVTIPEGLTAYTGKVVGEWLSLSELSTAIPAETAVVVKGDEGYYSFLPTEGAPAAGENDMKGTIEKLTDLAGYDHYILNQPEGGVVGFYYVTDQIPANVAYLQLPEGASVKGIRFGDATSINEMTTDNSQQTTVIYDLQGRRVVKAQKGIYIVNGKKVLR